MVIHGILKLLLCLVIIEKSDFLILEWMLHSQIGVRKAEKAARPNFLNISIEMLYGSIGFDLNFRVNSSLVEVT